MKEQSKEQKTPWFGALTTLISLLAPSIYLLGYFYEYGYFWAFGVSTEYFPRTSEHYFLSAFIFLLDIVERIFKNATNVFLLLGVAALFSTAFAILFVYIEKRRLKSAELVSKIKQWRFFDYVTYPLLSGFIGFAVPYMFFFIGALIMLIPILAASAGTQAARKDLSNYKKCNIEEMTTSEKCTSVYDANNMLKIKGYLVAKSEKYAAIFDGSKTIIYPTEGRIIEIVSGKKLPQKTSDK